MWYKNNHKDQYKNPKWELNVSTLKRITQRTDSTWTKVVNSPFPPLAHLKLQYFQKRKCQHEFTSICGTDKGSPGVHYILSEIYISVVPK